MIAAEVARISTYTYPFSTGWGNCVGQNLAMLDLLTTITRTLFRLVVRGEPGSTLGEGNLELSWIRLSYWLPAADSRSHC